MYIAGEVCHGYIFIIYVPMCMSEIRQNMYDAAELYSWAAKCSRPVPGTASLSPPGHMRFTMSHVARFRWASRVAPTSICTASHDKEISDQT
jgi:hypothetical protein